MLQPADASPALDDDARLVLGAGRYTADSPLPGQLAAAFVRAPHAHARIRSIGTAAARAMPGVVAVLTAADMGGIATVAFLPPMAGRGGSKLVVPLRPALAGERVMHVGEAVALVLAETRLQAEDAAGEVCVDYQPLPPVVEAAEALAEGAPELWPQAPGNLALDWAAGDEAAVAAAMAGAARVVTLTVRQQRLAGAPMEPRGATASHDAASGSYHLACGNQGAGVLAQQLARALGVEPHRMRVTTPDVGGAFGLKTPAYPDYAALLAAARLTGRPVHWMASRAEAFASDNQGRDSLATGRLALDAEGRFLALAVEASVNMGAYLTASSTQAAAANFARCFPSVYRVPSVSVAVRCAFTNTLPTGPYRGAGRPEANYLMERLVEAAARETGRDAVALRRRNMLTPAELPHRTALDAVYDSGDFPAVLDRALAAADHAGFEARRRTARAGGRLRGIGVAAFLEHAGAMPTEGAEIRFTADGVMELALGVQGSGQGQGSLYRALAARLAELPQARIRIVQGDSRRAPAGGPSVASRSTTAAGTAIHAAVAAMLAAARRLAAEELEVAEGDLAYAAGRFTIAGTDRDVALAALAARPGTDGRGSALDTLASVEVPQTFPNGCHVAEVEIDPQTGAIEVVRYVAVDDCGRVLDAERAEGQVIGGIAQGLGQALLERVAYDVEGQLLTGSFMDYALPRAADIGPIDALFHPVPATTNPLGVKGVGEAGTTGSIAAILNAVADAIPGGFGAAIDMPATAPRIWAACEAARKAGLLA